ncbi:hypothetical protein cyc_07658 [Cyclospora cayetanensis]|uniref:Uncharacterized protein n=1 Tax=Cyclospora cayetanensis TaxID=88456 RepID=A0A1D3D323_9EIME|nr:hypothetical protein cyc_07658 [Cyclospora cayetanensis]
MEGLPPSVPPVSRQLRTKKKNSKQLCFRPPPVYVLRHISEDVDQILPTADSVKLLSAAWLVGVRTRLTTTLPRGGVNLSIARGPSRHGGKVFLSSSCFKSCKTQASSPVLERGEREGGKPRMRLRGCAVAPATKSAATPSEGCTVLRKRSAATVSHERAVGEGEVFEVTPSKGTLIRRRAVSGGIPMMFLR